MEEKCILEAYNQNDELEKIEVLKYFSLKQNNKDYVIYKPVVANQNNDGLIKDELIFVAELEEKEDSISLLPIEDKEIAKLLKNITEELLKEGKI